MADDQVGPSSGRIPPWQRAPKPNGQDPTDAVAAEEAKEDRSPIPATDETHSADATRRAEASSSERTSSLRSARDAALANTSAHPSERSAQSPAFASSSHTQRQSLPPLPPAFHPPAPRLGLISDLKRLSYILSLLLGSSAVIGLFWSAFILPLLHSSFSARQVLLEQQHKRFERLLSGLRTLREGSLLPPARAAQAVSGDTVIEEKGSRQDQTDTDSKERPRLEHHRSGIEEIHSSASSSSSNHRRKAGFTRQIEGPKPEHQEETAPIPSSPPKNPLPLDGLISLSQSLRSLSSALSSTSTTRTSLLSTLESYTSQLHREVYLRTDPKSSFSVGLGSLSQNLANASGSKADGITGGTGWDDVRKEVRAIKGLLLGRRNFAPVSATN